MWSLYLLLNKILNIELVVEEEENTDGSFQPSSSGRKCQDAGLPCSHFVEVPHIKQLHSWDCGLACVLMALNTIGISSCSLQALQELCCTTSIWTVDLAYLLHKFSVRFSYYTVTLGANPNYSAETFYKEQLPTDLVRVDMLFQKAREEGINIQCRSINEKQISLFILSGKYVAIALVDQYKLRHSWLENLILPGLNGGDSGYAGHYVLICGYDTGTDEFEIRDPAISWKHERISLKCLEEARKSFGTDEDLLLISLENNGERRSFLEKLSPHLPGSSTPPSTRARLVGSKNGAFSSCVPGIETNPLEDEDQMQILCSASGNGIIAHVSTLLAYWRARE